MGYDLVGMGFIKADKYINDNQKNGNDKNSEGYAWNKWYNAKGELKDTDKDICYTSYSNGDYIEREDGEETQSGEQKKPIEDVKSWPIKWYMVSALRSYVNGTYGGMVVQDGKKENNLWNCLTENLTFQPESHTLKTVGLWKDVCIVNLEAWTAKYGVAYELLVCLHLGTLSPEFVLDLCGSEEERTKVIIAMYDQKGDRKFAWKDDAGNIVIEDLGTTIRTILQNNEGKYDEYGNLIITAKGNEYKFSPEFVGYFNKDKSFLGLFNKMADQKEIHIFYPYIKRTENHWYRDVVFYEDEASDDNNNFNCYQEGEETKMEVEEEWWKDGGYDSIEGLKQEGIDEHLYVYYQADSGIKQIAKPYYIDKCPKIIDLINNNKYHVFKGSYNNNLDDTDLASKTEEEKKKFAESLPYYTEPKKIKWLTSINAGIQLLQQVETEQAEYNLRDLKEILAYYNFSIDEQEEGEYSTATNQEEIAAQKAYDEWCSNWRNRVSGYVDTNGNVVNAIEGDEDPEGQGYVNWGKYIIPDDEDEGTRTANTSKLEDSSLNIAARGIGNTGFGYGESVCSTLNGKVVAVTESSITIKSDDGTLMHISNISTNSNMEVGNTVYVGTEVATTTDKNINVILKDKYHNTLDVEKYIDVAVLINAYA